MPLFGTTKYVKYYHFYNCLLICNVSIYNKKKPTEDDVAVI